MVSIRPAATETRVPCFVSLRLALPGAPRTSLDHARHFSQPKHGGLAIVLHVSSSEGYRNVLQLRDEVTAFG